MKIFFNLNYSGGTAKRMVKSYIKKLYKSFKLEINVKFVTHYKTTKISFFTNTKYTNNEFGCSCSYISKMELTLQESTEEYAYPSKKSYEQSAIYQHLATCPRYSHIVDLFNVNNHEVNRSKFDIKQIRGNTIVLDKADIGTNCYLKSITNQVAQTIIKHWFKSLERVAIANLIPPTSKCQLQTV